jgi:predicted esterase
MHRSLVRRPLALMLGLALLAMSQSGARAADKFSKVSFDTVDGVTIQGTFYSSPKGKDEPTVLLLHRIGSDSHKDGWDELAKALNDKGYSVLSFDFRGHGASTTVDPAKFWDGRLYPWNAKASRSGPMEKGKLKESISREGFVPSYYPYLVNDIAAAKLFLDDRNDASDCNSRALILIGAEDGAALGALWMHSEWYRFPVDRFLPTFRGPAVPAAIGKEPEGKGQFCAIWLSMTPSLGGKLSVGPAVKSGLRFEGREKKIPMGFLYGKEDKEGEEHAKEFLNAIKGGLASADDKLPYTVMKDVKNSKEKGAALLRKGLGTNDLILKYLETMREKRVPTKWSKIDWDRTGYAWAFPGSTRYILAKDEKAKAIEPIPLAALGFSN